MKNRILHLVQIAVFVLCAGVAATAGELDPDFGVDGRTAIEIGTHGDRVQAIAIQPDGKILLGGSSADSSSLAYSLIRLLPDGSPDPSFNGDGTVLLDFSAGDDEILALALTEEGDIFAGGYTTRNGDRDFTLLRFHSDGSLDTGFGTQGKVVTSVGNSHDEITAMAVDRDGTLLVSGSAEGTLGRVIVLGRYLENGSLDGSFADQGLSLIGIGLDVVAQGLVVREDGSAVISGSYADGETVRMVLAGFTLDGQIDTSFGENGVAVTAYTRQISEGYGLMQDQDGDLFVAGSVGYEGERDAAIFRFTDLGAPVPSFGENGVLVAEIGTEDDVFYSLAGDATTLNASGFTTTYNNRDFLLVSFARGAGEPDAAAEEGLDASTPQPEVLTTSFIDGESTGYAMAMQKDGKVVVAGASGDDSNTSMAVSRYKVSDKVTPSTKSVARDVNVTTLDPHDIVATRAETGGIINAALGAVTQRGVVFSIDPDPVCDSDCADGKDPGTNPDPGEDTKAPVITSTTEAGFDTGSEVILSVSTDESATCRYNKDTDVEYGSMTNGFSEGSSTSHTRSLGALTDENYTYYVRCTDAAGNVNATGTGITFTVGPVTAGNAVHSLGRVLAAATGKVGNILVPAAHAAATTAGSPSTSSSSIPFLDKSLVNEKGYTIDGSGSGTYGSYLNDLTPDTRYYARAYAITESPSGTKVVHYGQLITFETPNACFIATAAYGSILHPAVGVLRDFRDSFLKNSHLGQQFVYWYYKNSPPLADAIAASFMARFITRILLMPIIAVSWLLLHPQAVVVYCCVIGLMAMAFRVRHRRMAAA